MVRKEEEGAIVGSNAKLGARANASCVCEGDAHGYWRISWGQLGRVRNISRL